MNPPPTADQAHRSPMRILVVGTEGCGIDDVDRRLRLAGHRTMVMPSDDSGPRSEDVDLIVVARRHPLPHLTRLERRVQPLLHTELPILVAGSTVPNPYGDRATVLLDGFDCVVEACERLMSSGPATRAQRSALRQEFVA